MICSELPVIGVTAVTPACGGVLTATRGSGLTSTGFGCTEAACGITCTSNDFGYPRSLLVVGSASIAFGCTHPPALVRANP